MTFIDQFDPDKIGAPEQRPEASTSAQPRPPPEPRAPRKDAFSQFDPFPDEEVGGFASPKGETSTAGAFGRGMVRGAGPAIGSLPAIGAGAEAGAFLGTLGGPWAPVTVPVGTVVGGLAGGLGAGYAISAAQNWALKQLPSSWVEKLGMDDRQAQLDEAEHPIASFLGGIAPYAVTMRPGMASKVALPENATAMQRILAHPATSRVFGGAAMGGIELGQEAYHGEVEWPKVAISTGFGIVFNKPTRIGERLSEAGARPARALLGRPEPTVAAPAPAPADASTSTQHAPGAPAEVAAPVTPEQNVSRESAPPVTGDDFRKEITERTRTGRPYELPAATVADANDAGVMGPGVTEQTFHGGHEREPTAAAAAQDAKRTEQSLIGPQPPGPDVRAAARRMDPDTFQRYDELQGLRTEFSRWIEERNNPPDHKIEAAAERRDELQAELDAHIAERKGYKSGPEARRLRAQIREAEREHDALQERRTAFAEGRAEQTPELIQARQHLMAAEAGLRDLHPHVQAAYRRAADAVGSGTIEAEARPEFTPIVPAEEVPVAPAAALETAKAAPVATPAPAELPPGLTPGERTMPAPAEPPSKAPAPPEVARSAEPPRPLPSIPQQLAFIAGDVKRQLIRAGRSADEAEAAGHLVARRYEARAAHFKGALGTPEEMYRETAAEILGPGARSAQPRMPGQGTPRAPKLPERMSLLEFADHLGGLQRTGDLAHTLDESFKVRGRNLFRQDGLTEDRFREAASEAGYLVNNVERTGTQATLKELHEAIREEAKGNKRYRLGMERTKAVDPEQEAHAQEAAKLPDDPQARWEALTAEREAPTQGQPIQTGRNPTTTAHGAPLRASASQSWEPGNTVDAGFVKNLLIAEQHADGSFTLLSKPDENGTSQTYNAKPHEGLSKEKKVDFVEATKKLGEKKDLAPEDMSHLSEEDRDTLAREFMQARKANEPRMASSKEMQKAVLRNEWARHGRDLDFDDIWETDAGNRAWEREVDAWNEKHGTELDADEIFKNDAFRKHFEEKYLAGKKAPFPGVKEANEFFENEGRFDQGAYLPGEEPTEFNQSARGSILFRANQRPIMRLMAEQNASTFIHETGHEWLEQLATDAAHEAAPDALKTDAATIYKWLGIENHDDLNTGWKGERGRKARAAHERFATGFEQYLREGVAPSKELAGVFARFKNWLLTIYQTLKGLGKPINEDIRQVFDRMLSTEPERTVIAPHAEPAKSLADIHSEEASSIEPHEAEGAQARVDSERTRAYDEIPEHVRNAYEAADAKFYAEHEAANPPGEDGGGEDGLRTVQPAGGEPGPQPGGGELRPATGAQRTGVDEARAKGAGLPEAGRGPAGRGEAQSLPLAPAPAPHLGAGESPFTDRAGNIRLENLTTNDDVAQAIRESAAENNDFIGDRRGVVTDGQVMELADALGMDAAKLSTRKIGQAFNAEQVVAARKLLIESATHVSELMKRAATGTDEDLMAFAMAKDRHQMIQAQVSGITAEAGRALRAFRSIAGQEQAKVVGDFLKDATGKTLFQLRMEAKMGARLDTPAKVSKYLADGQKRTFGRMILEYWINGLISGPATHTTYMVGNAILAAEHAGPETAAAALIGNLRKAMGREGETVRLGEVGAQFRGAWRGLPGAVEASLEAMRSGQTTLLPGEQGRALIPFQGDTSLAVARSTTNDRVRWADVGAQMFGMVRGLRDGLHAGAELIKAGGEPGAPMVGFSYSPLGSIPDIAVRGVPVLPVGSTIRLPGRFIAAIHSFFRTAQYSMEKSALAYRTASEEGLTGTAFDSRVGDIWQNPSEATMERARFGATERTLMGHGSAFVQALGKLTNTPILGFPFLKFVDPFVHIAGNVLDQSIVKRTPVGLLAPEIRADIMGRNGTVAQDMAMARMLVGTALSVTFGGLAAQGLASGSGPSDPRKSAMWRLAGNQAHSVRVGDIWYDTHRLGPIGMLAGIAADMYEVAHTAEKGDLLAAGAHLQHAFTQNILDESFMRGPSELIRALEDPGRYGEAYLRNFVGSFVPFSVGMAQITRAADPYSRNARTVMDAIRNKVPGLSETLMPRIDIWGEPMANPDALGMAGLSAIYERKMSHDPVNRAMLDLGIAPAKVERKIRNVDLTDGQYDDFARIAGRMAKMRLDTIVPSPDFERWPGHVRHDVISEVIRQSREAARGMMMMKFPQIAKDAVEARRKKLTDEPKPIE